MEESNNMKSNGSKQDRSLWKTFAFAQGAAVAGTAVDFLVTIFCTELLAIWYVISTAIGSVAGAITNFTMGRYWVFQSTENKLQTQALRYALVSLGSLILNTAGVYALTELMHRQLRDGVKHEHDYIIAKVIVAVIVAVSYNFILQKNFVFKK